MAQTLAVKVKVQELTKYGYKANDRYVGYSKLFKDQARVVPGAEFEAEYYVADSGKEYLNKILASVPAAPPQQVVVQSPAPAVAIAPKEFKPKFQKKEEGASATMSKSEWQAKDRSQLIGGLSHDAAAITAAIVAVDTTVTPLAVYRSLLEGMLKIREEVK